MKKFIAFFDWAKCGADESFDTLYDCFINVFDEYTNDYHHAWAKYGLPNG